jgi:K+-transporting ATPase A subunit
MPGESQNLEGVIAKVSFELVNERILDENLINKLLGVLSHHGVYAMWLFAKSEKKIRENDLMNKMKEILEKISPIEEGERVNWESYFKELSSQDLPQLLFTKTLLEKLLTYARYHAKAMGESGGDGNG